MCQGVFDTQIAHRLIVQRRLEIEENKQIRTELSDERKHNNIALNGLLKFYLDVDNYVKDEVRVLMQKDKYFWLKVLYSINYL